MNLRERLRVFSFYMFRRKADGDAQHPVPVGVQLFMDMGPNAEQSMAYPDSEKEKICRIIQHRWMRRVKVS